jgi:hypothetical protein
MSARQSTYSQGFKEAVPKETKGYCLQMGSNYCKNECPNKCNDRFQDLVDTLFENMKDNNMAAK